MTLGILVYDEFIISYYISLLLNFQLIFLLISIISALLLGVFLSIVHRHISIKIKYRDATNFTEDLIAYVEKNLPFNLHEVNDNTLLFIPNKYYLQLSKIKIIVKIHYGEAIINGPFDFVKDIEYRFI